MSLGKKVTLNSGAQLPYVPSRPVPSPHGTPLD